MIKGIYTNAGAMVSLQTKQEVTANNIANASTTGFKKEGVFRKHLLDHSAVIGRNDSRFINIEDIDAITIDHSQGSFNPTGNPLDVAIEGKGFFAVQTSSGPMYTRNGNFTMDTNGLLVSNNGYQVLGQNGAIPVNGSNVFIGNDGSVNVDGRIVDTLQVVDFPEPYVLSKTGDGLFAADQNSATQAAAYVIRQGFTEDSNVEIVKELVEMIRVSRDFETNQKSITMQDSTLDRAVNDVGRLQ